MLEPIPSGSVFLSYSREDSDVARKFVRALERNGVVVWWDVNDVPVGVNFRDFVENRLYSSSCVILLLSNKYVNSESLRREAEIAVQRKVALPVLIENVSIIPLPLSQIQPAVLKDWDGDPNDPEFLRLLNAVQRIRRAAPSSAEEVRSFKESQRTAERRAQELFQRNLQVESTVEHFELSGTSFYDELNWNLVSGVNVLLGRNGYGKTYLLRSLVALLQYREDAVLSIVGDGSGSISITQDGDERSVRFANHFFDEEDAVGKIPVLAIPDMRFVNRSVTTLGAISDETVGKSDKADLASYGAWHFLDERPYESMIQGFLYGLCLDYFEHGLQFEGEQFELIRNVAHELTDRSFEFDRVAREGRDRFTLYVRTEGNERNPLPMQKASQGTLSVVAMFGLIYEFLKSLRQETTTDVCQRSGIVLIDEVDAHLHPTWQQKIVSLLRDRFPRTQFIVTAHNPIVVAGCLQDEVSVLHKNSDRGFTLYQFPNDFVGWQVEDIYRKVFGIEKPDDTFVRYDAMRPFKSQLERQAAELANQSVRNPDQDRSLKKIEEKIMYIEKAEDVRSNRLTQEELERENRILRDRILSLESRYQSAAASLRELEEVKAQLLESTARSQQEIKRVQQTPERTWVMAAICVILTVAIVSLLRMVPEGYRALVLCTAFLVALVLALLLWFNRS